MLLIILFVVKTIWNVGKVDTEVICLTVTVYTCVHAQHNALQNAFIQIIDMSNHSKQEALFDQLGIFFFFW